MSVSADDITQIAVEIWESMLGLEAVVVENPLAYEGREVRSAVQINGSWQGAFMIETPMAGAVSFTAAMLGYEDGEEPPESEVHDVIGELANMGGGNVKALIGGETRLSLPTVAVGERLDMNVMGATELVRVNFLADDQPFSCVVVSINGGS